MNESWASIPVRGEPIVRSGHRPETILTSTPSRTLRRSACFSKSLLQVHRGESDGASERPTGRGERKDVVEALLLQVNLCCDATGCERGRA